MKDCIFCRIIRGEIPCNKVYEDDSCLAFYDVNPQAKEHILVIPKLHIESAAGVTPENSAVIAHIYEVIAQIACEKELDRGFRVVTNCGEYAGQSVPHLHFHILGGEQLALQMC